MIGQPAAHELGYCTGQEDLTSIGSRHDALDPGERQVAEILAVWLDFCLPGMDAHAYFDWRTIPGFCLEFSLRSKSSQHSICRCMECCTKGIANDSENITAVGLN